MRKNFGHSVFPYFFIIFQSFKFWRFLRPLPSSVENGSECLLWRHRRSSTFARNTDFSWNLLLESCPTPVLFSVLAEQPIPKEVSGFIEFLSLMTHARKALKEDGNGWTLSSRGELNRSKPFLQRARLKTIGLLIYWSTIRSPSFSRRVFADLVLKGTRSSAKSKQKMDQSLRWGTIFICT